MDEQLTIEGLRRELGLTQTEFALKIGLANKASVSLLERGGPCSLPVALAIEALSGGRIDAGELNEDVKASRHALLDSAGAAAVSAGKSGGNSRLSDQGVA
jgi:DNA-binding XRE family transcriptional regulator